MWNINEYFEKHMQIHGMIFGMNASAADGTEIKQVLTIHDMENQININHTFYLIVCSSIPFSKTEYKLTHP